MTQKEKLLSDIDKHTNSYFIENSHDFIYVGGIDHTFPHENNLLISLGLTYKRLLFLYSFQLCRQLIINSLESEQFVCSTRPIVSSDIFHAFLNFRSTWVR